MRIGWKEYVSSLSAWVLFYSDPNYFLNSILECIVKPRVEEAQMRVQTANGVFSKGVAIVNEVQITTLYEALKLQKNASVMALNCIDAVVTGENASTTGAVCDFVTALFAIGDVRDMYIQAYNAIWDPEHYDNTIRILAILGTTTTVAIASGGGAALDATLAAAKQFVKALRRLGPAGVKLKDLVGSYLDSKVISAASPEKAKAALELAGGFLQLGAYVSLEGQNLKPVLNMMADGIDNVTDMETWFGFIERFGKKFAGVVALKPFNDLLDLLIPAAHAGLGDVITSPGIIKLADALKTLQKYADELPKPLRGNSNIGKNLNVVIRAIEKGGDEGLEALELGMKNIDGFKDTLKALMFISSMPNGYKMVRHLQRYRCSSGCYSSFTDIKDMMKGIADIGDYAKLGKVTDEAMDGFEKMFADLASHKGFSQGATEVVFQMKKLLGEGKTIKGVEVEDIVEVGGKSLGNRRYDMIIGDPLKKVEVKSWNPEFTGQRLKDQLKKNISPGDGGKPGQLYKDLLSTLSGESDKLWVFDKRNNKADIIKAIKEGVEEPNVKRSLMQMLGYIGPEASQLFQKEVLNKLDGTLKI